MRFVNTRQHPISLSDGTIIPAAGSPGSVVEGLVLSSEERARLVGPILLELESQPSPAAAKPDNSQTVSAPKGGKER